MKRLGRPPKILKNQDIIPGETVKLQVFVNKSTFKALKVMANFHDKPVAHYLHNFFKDFISHESNVIDNEGLKKTIKELLDKVKYI
jgi:hypothetical protein